MRVIHISAECYPVAKIGGLADVVGACDKLRFLQEPKFADEMSYRLRICMI